MAAPLTDRHETLSLRLEVGHESVLLAQPRATYPCAHTHKWTVFVRGQNETSLEPNLVQKVVFNLHEDFPTPKRVVTSPPYEVSETGYGGFMIPIYILFAHSKKEQYLEYDMNLKYAPFDKNKEIRVIEFKDPKPELRAKLLKAGAEIVSAKSAKGQGSGKPFQDLFGETLQKPSPPPSSSEKPKAPSTSTSSKRPVASPSTDSSSNVRQHAGGKDIRNSTITPNRAQLDKKQRKPKSNGRPKESSQVDEDTQRPGSRDQMETSDAARCVVDASNLPPFVSPLGDYALATVSDLPSVSNSTKDGDTSLGSSSGEKKKKAVDKCRQKGAQSSANVNKGSRVQNGSAASDGTKKRKKTKSDSGLDSDYSSGVPNISPCITNGHNSGAVTEHNGASALFSPPDSVRSLDTLQESPVSAASCSSGRSGTMVSSRQPKKTLKDNVREEEEATTAGTSASNTTTSNDPDRLQMLLTLQQKIMTIQERRVAQLVADIISAQGSYEVTPDCLEFDLYSLDTELIQRLVQALDLPVR